jgi:hypothetical protein
MSDAGPNAFPTGLRHTTCQPHATNGFSARIPTTLLSAPFRGHISNNIIIPFTERLDPLFELSMAHTQTRTISFLPSVTPGEVIEPIKGLNSFPTSSPPPPSFYDLKFCHNCAKIVKDPQYLCENCSAVRVRPPTYKSMISLTRSSVPIATMYTVMP